MSNRKEVVSASLLENIVIGPVSPRFNIGMDDWMDYDLLFGPARSVTQANRKRSTSEAGPSERSPTLPKKLALAIEPCPTVSGRFAKATKEEIDKYAERYVPKKTDDSTQWSVRTFRNWMKEHNERVIEEDDEIPEDILESMNPQVLNKWLSVFIVEARKVNCEPYPPTTLHNILSGILRYMRSLDPHRCPNFFSKSDTNFVSFRNTMDSVFRKLREDGVGVNKKHAKPFSKAEESQLWDSGVLGTDNPLALQRAVFYYNGKNFCLRGGVEHRELKLSQLRRNSRGYTYTENVSKNRTGGISQFRLDNKSVFIPAVPEAGDRCHCSLLDKYISKLPAKAIEADLFYVRSLAKVTKDSPTWYTSVPLGKNKLYNMVKDMCNNSGIEARTNHSLRATGATSLFNAGVPKKMIKDITGHLSDEALRMYERPSETQQQAVANVLASSVETSFQAQMNQLSTTNITPNNNTSCPVMNFNNCQVNITYNQGNVSGTVSSHQQTE